MSKNLTRKGLALGAVVALGSTLLAGTPASAAPAITIAPNAGTSYSFLSGEEFTLKVYGNSEFTTGFTNLKWEVKNSSATAVTARATNGSAALAAANPAVSSATDATSTVTPAGIETTAGGNKLGLAIAATAEAAYQVRAYIELDGTAGLTAGDLASQSETVTFVKQANVTSTVAITSPVEGNTAVTASVRFNNINNEQLTNTEIGLGFTKGDDSTLDSTASKVQKAVAAWSATDGFVAATDTIAALVKDTAVKVQAFYKNSGVAYTSTEKIGAAQTASVVARKVATFTAAVVRSATAKDGSTGTATSLLNSAFVAKATAKDSSTTPVAVAGSAVTVKVASSRALSATAGSVVSLNINGTTYTDSAKLPGTATTGDAKVATTTDANGEAKISITAAGFTANDTITVTFYTENFESSVVVTETAATYAAYITNKSTGASTTPAGSVALDVAVYDQFGGVPADEYDARAIWVSSSNGRTTASTSASSVSTALVGGKATLTVTDNGAGTGTNVYNVVASKRVAGGGYTGSDIVADANFEVQLVDAANLVAGKITNNGVLNADTKVYEFAGPVALNLEATGSSDFRTVSTAPTFTNSQNLTGVVSTASSATAAAVAIEGASVTLSGTGLQFRNTVSGSNYVFAANSITVATNASGTYSVDVASNKAGKQTITITSGAATQTVTVVFAAAAATTGTSLVLTAPASVAPGRTFDVSGLLTDKFGNPVAVSTTTNVSVAYDGPGQVVSSLPTTYGTDGVAKFRVVLASNDSGSATVTYKYDANADGDFADTGDLVKTATVSIAAAAAVEPTSKIGTANSRVYVNVKDGKGAVVSVKIGAKWYTRTSLNNDYTLSFKAVAKKKVSVKVYVDGDLSSSKTIVVKK
jgi:trimeric autotransporter adhesin